MAAAGAVQLYREGLGHATLGSRSNVRAPGAASLCPQCFNRVPVQQVACSTAWQRRTAGAVRQSLRTVVRSHDNEVRTTTSTATELSSSSSSNGSSQEQPPAPIDDPLLASLSSELSGGEEEEGAEGASGSSKTWLASLSVLGGIGLLIGGGYVFREPIKLFLDFFINAVDEWGPWGYLAYAAVYTGLEVLAVPAIPLTMTAGVIFGPIPGTIITSISATIAATIAFLIARYAARDKVAAFAAKNKRFAAIDRAISRDGLKFVTLLRLSPLLPLAASNYLYGLTSVDLGSYVLGSWLGMLPGTYAYVTAGHVGKAVLTQGEGSINFDTWQVGLALGATAIALGFVGQLAKKAIDEADAEALADQQRQQQQQQQKGGDR